MSRSSSSSTPAGGANALPPVNDVDATTTPPGTGAADALNAPPAADTPLKVTQAAAATGYVQETVQTTTGRTGEPTSATLAPETFSFPTDPALTGYRPGRPLRTLASSYAGTLPARTHVLASGREVEISARAVDHQERVFTAAIRILRSGKLYEPGAPVPLTEREFEAKRDARAIKEVDWDTGDRFDPAEGLPPI